METNFTYWGTFLKKLRQFELSVLKILSVYYFLCGLYPWIMLLVNTSASRLGRGRSFKQDSVEVEASMVIAGML